jgi:hypothetical protein
VNPLISNQVFVCSLWLLCDSLNLPEILQEFRGGNFVVKQSNTKYNQVDPDQSQEWLNATGKKGVELSG